MAKSSEKILVGKRKRKMINFEKKIEILDLLKDGIRPSHVAKKYSLNRSTIRQIKKDVKKIRENVRTFGKFVKVLKISRKTIIEKTELIC